MDIEVVALAGLAALWSAAGILAERLPVPDQAGALRRRATTLLAMVLVGGATMAAYALTEPGPSAADRMVAEIALPAVPAGLAVLLSTRRLWWIRAGAGAFAAAPDTPVPPGLRAAAAHPLLVLPIQVTGLAMTLSLADRIGLLSAIGAGVTGSVLAVAGLAAVTIGVRHALRHSRLLDRAVTVPGSSPPVSVLPG